MHEFVIDKCELIEESIKYIQRYTENIFSPDDFKKSQVNFIRFDATMMRLPVIGENIKKIIKSEPEFFTTDFLFDTNNIIRFRDFISHHYEKLDTDIVFDIRKNDIPVLKQKI
ncbi:MAG: DUF86 domain-containing protein, partial [Nitrosopumilus sp.]|nr:DUF86 domain-containing protein [Nitrosopumilus sp.]